MAILTDSRREFYTKKIEKLEARLLIAENAMDGLLSAEGVESFKFDSGEANAWAKYYTPEKLQELIDQTEARISWYQNKLNRKGIVSMNLRRN